MCRSRSELSVDVSSAWNSISGGIVSGDGLVEALAQQAQALHRVDGVHRPLERQVDVGLGEQHDRLVDDQLALVERELAGRGEHARQVDRRRPQLLAGRTGVDEERRRVRQGDRLAVQRRQPALDELGQVAGSRQRCAGAARSSTTVSGSRAIGSVTQNEYGWAAVAKPSASISARHVLVLEVGDDPERVAVRRHAAGERHLAAAGDGTGRAERAVDVDRQLGQARHRVAQRVDGAC